MTAKQCNRCRRVKAIERFSRSFSKIGTPGTRATCKACMAAIARHRRHHGTADQKARNRAATQKYQQSEKFKRAAKNWKLKAAFGITLKQYEHMVRTQNGLCAICHKPETVLIRGKPHALCVDHDHTTGQLRQLLCAKCNRALGLLRDDPIIVKNMLDYLRHHDAACVLGQS